MESENIEIFNPRDWPFGKLSINQHFDIDFGAKSWSSVTNYIYSSLLYSSTNRQFLSIENVRNIPEKFKQYSQNEYRQLMEHVLEKVFTEVLNQHPEIREMLLQTVGTRIDKFRIIYRSNNTILGTNQDGNGHNIYGTTLKSVLHHFLTNKQLAKEAKDKEDMDDKIFDIYLLYKYLTDQAKSDYKSLDEYSRLDLDQMFKKVGGAASLRSKYGINKDVILQMYYGDISEEERERKHEEREELRRLSYEKPTTIYSLMGGLFGGQQEDLEPTRKFEKIPYVKHKVTESLPQVRLFVKDPSFIVPYIKKEVFRKLRSVKEFQIRSGVLNIYADYILDKFYHLSDENNSRKLFSIEYRMEIKKMERAEYTKGRAEAADNARKTNMDPKEQSKIFARSFSWLSEKDLDSIIDQEWKDLKTKDPDKYEEYTEMSVMELNMKAREQAFSKISPYDKSKLEKRLYDLYEDGKLPSQVTDDINLLVAENESNIPSEQDITDAESFDFTTFDDVEIAKTEEEYKKNTIEIYPEDSDFVPEDQKKFLVMSPATILGINYQGRKYPSICHILTVQALSRILTPSNASTSTADLAQKFVKCPGVSDKTMLCFGDKNGYRLILKDPNSESRKPNNFITPDECGDLYTRIHKKYTDELKIQKMKEGINKMYENLGMAELLLLTGTRDIIFTDRSDSVLGIGKRGDGENMVGVYLMEIRGRITLPVSTNKVSLEPEQIEMMLSDPFFKGWIEMRVRDTCQLLQIMQQYLYDTTGINDQYKPRFVEYVQDYMFQSCFSMYSAADLISIPPPSRFRSMLTIKAEEESQVLLWNRIAVQIQYLAEYTSDLTPQKLKQIILGCEQQVTESEEHSLLALPNPDKIIGTAIINLVKAISLFNKRFDLPTKITNLEVDVACAIILNKPNLSKVKRKKSASILELSEILEMDITQVIRTLNELEMKDRYEWFDSLTSTDKDLLMDTFGDNNIELRRLLIDEEDNVYDDGADDGFGDYEDDEDLGREMQGYEDEDDDFLDVDEFETLIPPTPDELYNYILMALGKNSFEISDDIPFPDNVAVPPDSDATEIFTYYVYLGIDYIKNNQGYKPITKNRLNFFAHMNMRN